MKAKLSAFGFSLYSENRARLAHILLLLEMSSEKMSSEKMSSEKMSSEETTNHWIEQGCPDVVNR